MHVLFLYASTGSGHLKAARYVEEALLEKGALVTVTMTDVLSLCCYPVESFVLKAFRTLISRLPNTYRLLYRCTEKNDLFNRLAGLFFTRSIEELKRQCLSSRVNVIVCTHPLSLLFASRLKREMGPNAPGIMGIITDYEIHRFWLYPGIDRYCVPTDEMREELLQLGWDKDKVMTTGIPCPVNLNEKADGNSPEKPFWLVSGGGWGLGNLERTTKCLLKKKWASMLLVVTGENHSLYQRLKNLEKKNPDRIWVRGTIPHLYNSMKNALAVLTKPGGLTATEAMILKKPLILLDPLPGAEEKNLRYLVRHGAAIPYRTFVRQPDIIKRWQELYSKGQISAAKIDSSRIIAQWIMETAPVHPCESSESK